MNRNTECKFAATLMFVLSPFMFAIGCSSEQETSQSNNGVEDAAAAPGAPAATSAAPNVNARLEFQKMVAFLEDNVPARISWWKAYAPEDVGRTDGTLDKEDLKERGILTLTQPNFPPFSRRMEVENHSFDSTTNTGQIVWTIRGSSYEIVRYRLTCFYSNGWHVNKVEESRASDKQEMRLPLDRLQWSTDFTYMDRAAAKRFFEVVFVYYKK